MQLRMEAGVVLGFFCMCFGLVLLVFREVPHTGSILKTFKVLYRGSTLKTLKL